MAEYWKSTPKYWCKHCQTYVRDTRIERTNHESTAKHQAAVKRSLRELHRNHDREEAEKERARKEIERLSGVVSGEKSKPSEHVRPSASTGDGSRQQQVPKSGAVAEDRKRQLEELAAMGVAIPEELRGDMAMAGEWTVTATRVVTVEEPENAAAGADINIEARATGVRKREMTEEQKEEEEAIKGLFKRPRRWGRDSKLAPTEGDEELDALLSEGGLGLSKQEPKIQPKTETKEETGETPSIKQEPDVENEDGKATGNGTTESAPAVKAEAGVDNVPPSVASAVKSEDDGDDRQEGAPADEAVMFKKRKAKNVRRK